MKKSKKNWSLAFCKELASSTDSSLSPEQFGLSHWEKNNKKAANRMRSLTLYKEMPCHHWLIPIFYASNFMLSLRKGFDKKAQTRCDHLHFTRRCHHQLNPIFMQSICCPSLRKLFHNKEANRKWSLTFSLELLSLFDSSPCTQTVWCASLENNEKK